MADPPAVNEIEAVRRAVSDEFRRKPNGWSDESVARAAIAALDAVRAERVADEDLYPLGHPDVNPLAVRAERAGDDMGHVWTEQSDLDRLDELESKYGNGDGWVRLSDEFVQDVVDYLSEPFDGEVELSDRVRAALRYAQNDGERAGEAPDGE